MTDTPSDPSVSLFFDSFAKQLRRIRDDGKDASQAYRAQILLGQLQQFEKSIEESRPVATVSGDGTLGTWMHIGDLDALIHWLTQEQGVLPVVGAFYLDRLAVWQNLFGEEELPKRLKVSEWLERGAFGRLEDERPYYLFYAHGQPRLLLATREVEPAQLALLRFVARLFPLFVDELAPHLTVSPAGIDMIAHDPLFLEVLTLIKRVAAKDVTILLEGESGTGKEVIANFIHRNSSRKDKPFVAVNCAAIPAGLIESELFGHEKGAFTGAHQRKIGRLEEAQGGTLFLDEIGEVELAMQAKLLRFIQLREFHRVGGRQKLSVNVRIIAATNRDLKARVAEGHFREDLYYRLSVAPFRVPPLRKRVDDIVPLARFFLRKYAVEFHMAQPDVDPRVFQMLAAYPFPGNVRELENLIQKILVLAQGDKITPVHLPAELQKMEPAGRVVQNEQGRPRTWRPTLAVGRRIHLRHRRAAATSAVLVEGGFPWQLEMPRDNEELKQVRQAIQDFARDETMNLERRFLEDLLERAEGSMPTASKLSGINRTLLYKMLERCKSG